MKIYLVGMPACGKSTVAKKLAKKLQYRFCDLDKMIEEATGMSIAEYFEKNGEQNFRIIEREILRSTFAFDNAVVATGGGTPCFFNNIDEINRNGISIYLHAPINLIISRLNQKEQSIRPLINSQQDLEERRKYLEKLFEQRSVFYEKTHKQFSALNVDISKIIDETTGGD